MMTKFMASAPKGSPARSKTVTKGLSPAPAVSKGTKAATTAMAPTKKIVRRRTAVRRARGMQGRGPSTRRRPRRSWR